MGEYIANQVSELMTNKHINVDGSNILIMGMTFKENCPDIRNTRVVDVVEKFNQFNCNVDIYDPWVNKIDAEYEYGIVPIDTPAKNKYDAIVLAVSHNEFKNLSLEQVQAFGKYNHVIYDVKYLFDISEVDGRL